MLKERLKPWDQPRFIGHRDCVPSSYLDPKSTHRNCAAEVSDSQRQAPKVGNAPFVRALVSSKENPFLDVLGNLLGGQKCSRL
jgi:hypothetical protein